MGCSKLDCIQRFLENCFEKYGRFVGKYPLPFIILPIAVTALLAIGMANFSVEGDIEYLYTPTNGPAKDERAVVKTHFAENYTHYFQATRKANRDGFFQVLITSDVHGGNVFVPTHLQNVLAIDQSITSLNAGVDTSFSDICARWKGDCNVNPLITILNGNNLMVTPNVTYPLHETYYFLGLQLGGVAVDGDANVLSAEAVLLSYYLIYSSEDEQVVADKWLQKAKEWISTVEYDGLSIHYQTSLSLDEELQSTSMSIIPLFSVTYTVLMTFCTLTCLMADVVRTKPWFAMAGEAGAVMAIVSSLGILSAAGLPFILTVGTMPFLIIGIGIDDMFVILSSWRHTSYTLPAEERLALTYKTAAISITVTSITDALAFGIGAATSFRAVTIFCAYTGVAVLFSYIYAVTFLAGVLAISGRREEANRHAFSCLKVLPKSHVSGDRSKAYMVCCTGGYINEDIGQSIKDSKNSSEVLEEKETLGIQNGKISEKQDGSGVENGIATNDKTYVNNKAMNTKHGNMEMKDLPWLTLFIQNKFANFVIMLPVKIVIIIVYLVYIVMSIRGCLLLKEGLQLKNLAPDDSYLAPFFNAEDKYFKSTYGPPVMFAVTEVLDYSNEDIRSSLFTELAEFRNMEVYYNEEIYFDSWLSSFLQFLQENAQPVPDNMNDFIFELRNNFLTHPYYEKFLLDIEFNHDYTNITASRFLIQAKGTVDSLEERTLMLETRALAEKSVFNLTVYHFGFTYFDQYTVIVSNTLQNLGIAVVSMLLVAFLLLPSVFAVFWVVVSVASICLGVVGFMAFWNVALDSISMINLIICIGFSVDFSAHICYHFSISKAMSGNSKVKDALGHLGAPIVQGAMSTVLGVLALSISGTYIFRTFFKIMFLVMVFGFTHAMFLLPVTLSWTSFSCKK